MNDFEFPSPPCDHGRSSGSCCPWCLRAEASRLEKEEQRILDEVTLDFCHAKEIVAGRKFRDKLLGCSIDRPAFIKKTLAEYDRVRSASEDFEKR